MSNQNVLYLEAGLDIGNGYVKGGSDINGGTKSNIDFLSGVAYQTHSHDIKTSEADLPAVIGDIFNYMEASFDSPAIVDNTRRLFGRRGVQSGRSMEEFDVSSSLSKAQQDLSSILVLGSIAGKALQYYWDVNKALPDDMIEVRARIGLALPITEFKAYRKAYAAKFKEGSHIVSIHNFEKQVRVQIVIEDVQVLAEGASAQYAIIDKGVVLMNSMLNDLRLHGDAFEGITAQDILQAQNTIGVDIGEGTTNFPVFLDGKFNPDSSATFNKGYGTVLEQARERIQASGLPGFNSRKALSDFLQREPSRMQLARYNKVLQIVNEEIEGFCMEITQEFRKVISRVGSYVEVVYVYGGGATPVKDVLYPSLLKVSQSMGGEDMMYPILYLDSRYSRYLNEEGLYLVVKRLSESLKKKKVDANA